MWQAARTGNSSTKLATILSQITRLTDRQTDGRTDGQTYKILIARPRLHCTQRGKNDEDHGLRIGSQLMDGLSAGRSPPRKKR